MRGIGKCFISSFGTNWNVWVLMSLIPMRQCYMSHSRRKNKFTGLSAKSRKISRALFLCGLSLSTMTEKTIYPVQHSTSEMDKLIRTHYELPIRAISEFDLTKNV